MKNWKKIGQSIATGAALLASFASLFFASSEAHAFKLIRENGETGAVTRIEGLSVSLEGVETLYDVDFLGGSAVDVYGEDLNFDFADSDSAEAVTRAAVDALGTTEYVGVLSERVVVDGFLVPFRISEGVEWWGDWFFLDKVRDAPRLFFSNVSFIEVILIPDGLKWAKFSRAAETNTATTPEPNLIFGFITLGGLMLGSNARKTKV